MLCGKCLSEINSDGKCSNPGCPSHTIKRKRQNTERYKGLGSVIVEAGEKEKRPAKKSPAKKEALTMNTAADDAYVKRIQFDADMENKVDRRKKSVKKTTKKAVVKKAEPVKKRVVKKAKPAEETVNKTPTVEETVGGALVKLVANMNDNNPYSILSLSKWLRQKSR